ncbi:chlorophyllide a oxygenase, chloroplastic-like [Lolium perenne]|uniref:chlorophyllide a oxygenase, chloroplastic-like n=1 Tax=Lolium perenne TaxID=4522 RepID=UPI003A993E81
MTTAASMFRVSHLLIKPSFRCLSRKGVGRYGEIKVYAVLRDDGADYLKDNGPWEALFDDPGPRVPIELGKFLDAKQVLNVVRFNIQYCEARQDLLTIICAPQQGARGRRREELEAAGAEGELARGRGPPARGQRKAGGARSCGCGRVRAAGARRGNPPASRSEARESAGQPS